MSELVNAVLTQPIERVVALIHQNATWAWAYEQFLLAQTTGQIAILGGIGLDEQMMTIGDPETDGEVYRRIKFARSVPCKMWRGFNVQHIQQQQGLEFHQLDVFAALEAGARYLTQPLFDFLTLRDEPTYNLEVALIDLSGTTTHYEDSTPMARTALMSYSPDEMRLAYAFRQQMIDEAAPQRRNAAAGVYVLDRTSFPYLDHQIDYDRMRLVIHPAGIFVAILLDELHQYVPFFWTPEGINTSQMWVHPRAVFALDAMLACVWRDACIVREQWSERQQKRGYEFHNRPKHANPVVLPRIVYRSKWGSSGEREYIEQRSRSAHAVRAFYRTLPDGYQAHEADERAAEFGYPPPPDGHTFVKPHMRGEGALDADRVTARRVVCRGLQVAKIVLG